MKSLKEHFTPDQLRTYLEYSPETGVVRWKPTARNSRRKVDSQAGSLRATGYLNIRLKGKNILAHRVGWAIHFGAWPQGILDHINGQKDDNRIANLRLATIAGNAANSGPRSNNKAGIKGVYETPSGRWKAWIRINGRNIDLGLFDTADQASEAYQIAAREAHGEFAACQPNQKEVTP